MKYTTHIADLRELAETEGVFTTAQAERFGISPNDLSQYSKRGIVERIAHGAYRLRGVPAAPLDELAAIWKLTDAAKFSFERSSAAGWDGIFVSGSTAAAIHGIGDFHLSPYRILSPQRLQSRNRSVRFGRRAADRRDVSFIDGIPVASLERTLLDLVLDEEDPSQVQTALNEAREKGIDEEGLLAMFRNEANKPRYEYAVINLLGEIAQ